MSLWAELVCQPKPKWYRIVVFTPLEDLTVRQVSIRGIFGLDRALELQQRYEYIHGISAIVVEDIEADLTFNTKY